MMNWHTELDSPVTDPRIGRRLFGFVAASLLLHSAVMVSSSPDGETGVLAVPPMQISLRATVEQSAAVPDATAIPALQKPTIKPPAPAYSSEERVKPIQQPTPTSAVEATAPLQPIETTSVETQSLAVVQKVGEVKRNQLKQLLREAIANQRHYPKMARKQGWQGEVLVAFTLTPHGRISDERIVQHSGYSMLDRAALKTLRRVNISGVQIPEPLDYELPIPFHLIEG